MNEDCFQDPKNMYKIKKPTSNFRELSTYSYGRAKEEMKKLKDPYISQGNENVSPGDQDSDQASGTETTPVESN